jgi:hypothetical protein
MSHGMSMVVKRRKRQGLLSAHCDDDDEDEEQTDRPTDLPDGIPEPLLCFIMTRTALQRHAEVETS